MLFDIFSSFDPYSFYSTHKSSTVLLSTNVVLISLFQLSFWINSTRINIPTLLFLSMMKDQLSRTLTFYIKGSTSIMSTLFMAIILINFMGLIPYTFSLSSHLIFTLSFGLPLWMSFLMSSMTKLPKKTVAHFLPDGAPDWLNPFLILIESTSVLVRPITLSFRLAANMSAGHIVLSLVSIYAAAATMSNLPMGLLLSSTALGYILFEMAICLIQAYIFCLLLSLYANEHAH